ncbi:thiamine diphosphate-binding protein [Gymnopilus junonius]|uniref:Thiamine diphosphate-binding protein n=1 Tax=Gymnopilus junonius TaxID=109634 RepID=A0A9P5NIH6_GYMJU|nr:thiamine diphosphate-binding protein [Gymnopilus junonius]
MASLARLRHINRLAIPRAAFQVRSVQTTADTTQLHNKPDDVHTGAPMTVRLHEDSFKGYNCEIPDLEVQITKDELLVMYKQMQTVRRMEMAADALYKAKLVRGFCHLAIGQEAVSVGLEHGITKTDRVPIGAGVSFAQKYLGEKTCTFALYGDGASNQGQVFEAFNMAKLWNLPTYGMGTSAARSSSNTDYYTRGDKIPGLQVNGMDIIAAKRAVEYARKWAVDDEKGPLLLEFVTYRYGGHSMSDPGTTYRTREEVQRMRSTQDPIRGLQKYIEEWGVATEQELKALDKEAKAEVDQAVEEAKQSPEPQSVDLWSDIYYKGTEPPRMRGREREEVG